MSKENAFQSSGTWRPEPLIPMPHLEWLKSAQLGQAALGCFVFFLEGLFKKTDGAPGKCGTTS